MLEANVLSPMAVSVAVWTASPFNIQYEYNMNLNKQQNRQGS